MYTHTVTPTHPHTKDPVTIYPIVKNWGGGGNTRIIMITAFILVHCNSTVFIDGCGIQT